MEVAEVGHRVRTHPQARSHLLIRRRKRIPKKLTLTLIQKRSRKKAQRNQKGTLQSGMHQLRGGIQKEKATRDPRAGLAASIRMKTLMMKSHRILMIGHRLVMTLIERWTALSIPMKG